jgi:predicted ATPase
LICEALAAATGQTVEYPYQLSILAETYLRAGRFLEAKEQLQKALSVVDTTGERWFQAELHRLAGEAALKQGSTAEAEAQFQRAFDIAREQSARMWELRAAKALARVWQNSGKPAEARGLLAPVIHGFTEGFDTMDLVEGNEILGELA